MKVRTCPNCGANVEGTRCRYCGALDDRIFHVKHGTPVMVSYAIDNREITFQLFLEQLQVSSTTDMTTLYADDKAYMPFASINGYDVTISGHLVPFNHESLSDGRTAWYMSEDI